MLTTPGPSSCYPMVSLAGDLASAIQKDGVLLLGPIEVWWAGVPVALPRRQQRLLVAALALSANRMVSLDRLVDLFWPDDPPRGARRQIQVLVSRLRSLLAQAQVGDQFRIVRAGAGYSMRIDPMRVDAHRFALLAEQGRDSTDDEQKADLWASALALWRGPALDGLEAEPASRALIAGLEESRRAVLEDRLEASLRLGRHREVLSVLVAEVAAAPTRERLVGLLILALHRSGRTGEALDECRKLRERLKSQLGLELSPAIVRLYHDILRGDHHVGSPGANAGRAGRDKRWRVGEIQGEGTVLLGLGRLRFTQDRFAEAVAAYQQALRLFKRISDMPGRAAALSGLGTVRAEGGSFDEATELLDDAVALFARTSDLSGYAHARYMLGFVQRERGDDDRALSYLTEALTAYRRIGDLRGQALLQRSVGMVYRANDDYQEASACFRESRRLFAALGDWHGAGYAMQALAKIHIRRGDVTEAGRELHQSLRVCREQEDRFGEALVFRTLGELAVAQDDPDDARQALVRSLALWEELDLPLWRARTLRVVADLEARHGSPVAARQAYQESSEAFVQAGSREAIVANIWHHGSSTVHREFALDGDRMTSTPHFTSS
ncbi:BTAD domain-containing putative transcriptional regulator [Nonomuraea sp. JJY05]|uniref:BTAD domain-containing putative transcriptional regulator n=1 Tax=Nonomuraea sp. JJY05 TaxID=3350255 RepID=UPI00373F22E6